MRRTVRALITGVVTWVIVTAIVFALFWFAYVVLGPGEADPATVAVLTILAGAVGLIAVSLPDDDGSRRFVRAGSPPHPGAPTEAASDDAEGSPPEAT